MRFVLILYLFMPDGSLISERHCCVSTMNECLTAGAQYSTDLWKRHGKQGTINYMCLKGDK